MRYDRPDLQDRLAAQYALGALTGPARRRLEALMRDRPDLRNRVAAWQERLAPLAETAHPTVPPAHVLTALHRRLFHDHPAERRPFSWDRIAVWRWLAGAAVATAAALLVYVAIDLGFVGDRPAVAERQIAPSYVAVLSDDSDRPGLVVTAFDRPWRLAVEPLETLSLPEGSALQIWAVERGTGARRPLAKVVERAPIQLAMSDAMWSMVQNAESLVVSLDGSDPDGSGAVLYSGLCIRLDGPPELRSGAAPGQKWPDD